MASTTDEGVFSMKWNKFIPMLVFIIVATNSVSIIIQNVLENQERIQYNNEASKRRIEHAKNELRYEMDIKEKEVKIEKLEEELSNCKNTHHGKIRR